MEPLGALGVGAIGAICCVFAARGLKKLNLVDDSLDCFSLHGVGGFAGAILGGFFDTGDGLIYGGDGLLLAKNLAGAAFGVVYSAAVTAVIFFLMRVVMRMRVSEEQELEGTGAHVTRAKEHTDSLNFNLKPLTLIPKPRTPRRWKVWISIATPRPAGRVPAC